MFIINQCAIINIFYNIIHGVGPCFIRFKLKPVFMKEGSMYRKKILDLTFNLVLSHQNAYVISIYQDGNFYKALK